MIIVAIGGFGSGSGKTALLERALARRSGLGAVKTSPRTAERLPPEGFAWVTDLAVLAAAGSDTRRYLDAGAVRAGWLRSVVPPAPAAGAAVRSWARDLAGVLVEGISVAAILGPDRRVVVAAAGFTEVKPEAREILPVADLVVVNRHAGASRRAAEASARSIVALGAGARVLVADLAAPDDGGTVAALDAITAWIPS